MSIFQGTVQLEGMFSFINQLDYYNNNLSNQNHALKKSKQTIRNLNGRERSYQKFLFYKYFYAQSKPLIITEGKTDVRYIEAALKSLYEQFPDLITKKEDDTFEFKISFLHRTKRLKYFFDIDVDGADTYTKFFKNFLSGTKPNGLPDYYDYFLRLSAQPPENPIIFIFDNELTDSKKKTLTDSKKKPLADSKEKPLKKFVNETKLDNNCLQQKLCLNVYRNIFVATPPLINSKTEIEMEDLFSDQVLQTVINARTFDRNVKKGDSNHYGKEVFSDYIYENYKNIDFSYFEPLLKAIQLSISEYKVKRLQL